MVNCPVASLCEIVAPGKALKPPVLILDCVDRIVIGFAQYIKQQARLVLRISVHVIEDSSTALSSSSTLTFTYGSVETDLFHQILVFAKAIICVVCVLEPLNRSAIHKHQGDLVNELLVRDSDPVPFAASEEIALFVIYSTILTLLDLVLTDIVLLQVLNSKL